MDDAGFCGIVRSLELGHVDDVSAHAGRRHKATVWKVDLFAIEVGPFGVLSSPVLAGSSSTVEGAIKVG